MLTIRVWPVTVMSYRNPTRCDYQIETTQLYCIITKFTPVTLENYIVDVGPCSTKHTTPKNCNSIKSVAFLHVSTLHPVQYERRSYQLKMYDTSLCSVLLGSVLHMKPSFFHLGLFLVVLVVTCHKAITYLVLYPFFRLLFGTLYPAYASYKAVRTKNVKEYVSN